MAKLRADVLVTHEALSPHSYGFAAIDELARSLRVSNPFYGHHYDSRDYSATWGALGVQARGVGFRGITDLQGRVTRAGDYDNKAIPMKPVSTSSQKDHSPAA